MIKTKDIKTIKHISDPTEEKFNNLKLVSQETNKDIVSIQGELTKDILKARSLERLDAIEADSSDLDDKIGEIETSVAEELTEITDRTEKVISDSEKYTEDIEAFLSVAKGDDFLFFLDDCTRAVGRLDKLTNGSYLCYGKNITSWDIPSPTLTNGSHMFEKSITLTSFKGELPALTNGRLMFHSCTALQNFNSELPALTEGVSMFANCANLKKWNVDLPMLKDAGSSYNGGMFQYDGKLEEWVGDLHALEIGDYMFYGCGSLSRFSTSALPSLKYATMMFHSCQFPSWNIDLPALIKGVEMFKGNRKLTSWNIDLPSMTDGGAMFTWCTSLARFRGDISALSINYYSGQGMFDHCTSLTSFSSALPALTDGRYMFNLCKLDLASVKNIADTINDLAAQSKTGRITIGMATELNGDTELRTALATIRNKGWTVTEQYN